MNGELRMIEIDRIIKQWIEVDDGSIGIPNLLAMLDFKVFDIKLNSH